MNFYSLLYFYIFRPAIFSLRTVEIEVQCKTPSRSPAIYFARQCSTICNHNNKTREIERVLCQNPLCITIYFLRGTPTFPHFICKWDLEKYTFWSLYGVELSYRWWIAHELSQFPTECKKWCCVLLWHLNWKDGYPISVSQYLKVPFCKCFVFYYRISAGFFVQYMK